MYGGYLDYCEHDGLRDGYRAPAVAYLTDAQNRRLEEIRRMRLLWKGKHRQYFLREGRTQFNFEKMRAQGVIQVPYMSVNLLKLVSTTFADLLLGKDPKLSSDDADEQEMIDELSKRTDLYRVFYDAVVQCSWAKEAMVEICLYDGEVYVENRKPDEIFPIGSRNPDGQYSRYERYAEAVAADGKTKFLLVTAYTAGLIERHCYRLSDNRRDHPGESIGGTKGQEVSLDLWPVKRPDNTTLPEKEQTGIDVPTIVWLGNELDEGEPTSDYSDDLIENQDHLNAAETQMAVVIAKHGNPKMYATRAMVNPSTGGVETSLGVFFVNNKDEAPGYITWNAELTSAAENKSDRKITMAEISELTPGLLGIRQGAGPESAEKLRLDCIKPLARTTRKAKYVGPFIRTALDTARALESHTKYVVIEQSPSSVTFRDPMPMDEQAQATAISLKRSSNAMSIERAVSQQIEDADEAATEVARIKSELAAAAPSIVMGAGPGGEPGENPNAPTAGEVNDTNDTTDNNAGDGSPADKAPGGEASAVGKASAMKAA